MFPKLVRYLSPHPHETDMRSPATIPQEMLDLVGTGKKPESDASAVHDSAGQFDQAERGFAS